MKKTLHTLYILFFLLLSSFVAHAQIIDTCGVTIKGSRVYVNSGTSLYIDGSIYNVSTTSPFAATLKGEILNNDTIYLAGNLANRIKSHPLFLFGGTVSLRYNFPQYVRNDTVNFHNLIINKTTNILTLQRSITIANQFALIKGNVNMVQYNIDLLNNGSLIGENFQNNIYSNLGWLIARNRLLSPVNVGDISTLNLELNPTIDNLGLTTIYRRNKTQDSLVDGSIERMYDVFSSNTGNSNVRFNYYDTEWQNLAKTPNETQFKLFSSTQTGVTQSNMLSWKIDTNAVVNTATNQVDAADLQLLNTGLRLTVASRECVEIVPISLPTAPVWFCNGDSVILDAGNAGNKYVWNTGATSRTIKLKTANIIGTKDTIGVFVYNSKGCRSFKSVEVNVFPKPTPGFATPASVCVNAPALYSNLSTITGNVALNYRWNFFDNTSSTSENTSKAYPSTGTFTAQLVATSPYGCKDSLTKSIIVQPKPIANFSTSIAEECVAKVINFTNLSAVSSGAIAQSNWTFGDGFSSALSGSAALNSEMKAYTNAGDFTIKLSVRSSGNCTDSITKTVKIHPKPILAFSASGLTSNFPTNFDNTSNIALGYSLTHFWDFKDGIGTSSDKSPVYVYTASGIYKPLLEVTSNKGCTDTLSKTIVLSGMPIANFSVSSAVFCATSSITCTGLSTVDAGTLSYAWDFGDGTTSAAENPIKQYTNAGTYTISLTVTAQSGLTKSVSKSVTVNPIPEARFVATSVCQGFTTGFTNTSSISSGTYTSSWDFGDGNVSTSLSPQHNYANVGTYTAKLFLSSDQGCKDTVEVITQLYPVPAANFSVSNSCQGQVSGFINLSSISGGTFSSFWSLGNATTSTQANPQTTYANAGTYNVSLNISSDNGCSASIQKNVQIYHVPTVNFSSSVSCTGDPTSFTNLAAIASGTLNFMWDFGVAGTSTGINPTIVFPNANSFSVQLTATSTNNCSKTISKIIEVKPLPTPDFNANVACLGQQTVFNNTSNIVAIPAQATLTFGWKFGNNMTSAAANPIQEYTSAGNYNVTLSATSMFGCKNDMIKTVTVASLPVVSFSLSNHCVGNPIPLTNTSIISGGGLTYLWNFNDGSTSNLEVPTKTMAIAKTHTVDLTVTSNQGCSAVVSNSVVVYPQANANFSHTSNICAGTSVDIIDNTNISSGTFSRLWDFGGQSSSTLINPSYVFNSAGVYQINLTTQSNRGCVKTVTSTITVSSAPLADFSAAPNVGNGIVFTNATSLAGIGTLSYVWTFGDGTQSVLTNPSYTYAFTGNYNVQLTASASNGCVNTKTKSIKVPYNNIADFVVSGGLCKNSVFNFTDKSVFSDNNLTYAWNFGDGSVSTLKNPTNTYLTSGNYQVTLIVTPSVGSSVSKTIEVIVYDAPQADFIFSNGCKDSPINFTNTSIDKTSNSFVWSLGDGSQATSLNASRTYGKSGVYPIQLKATSLQGCATLVNKNITIYDLPVIDFGANITTCGTSYPLNAVSSGASYLWSTGENTSSITVTGSGLYTVQVTNANSCKASASVNVVLNQPFSVDLGPDNSICETQKLDAGSPGGSYLWSDGNITRFLTVTLSGTYSVSVTDPNGCTSSDNINVTILPTPNVNLGADKTICTNILTELDAQNTGSTYLWSNGQTSQRISLSNSGIYQVEVTNGSGCKNNDEIVVTVLSAPVVSLGSNVEICDSNFPYQLSVANNPFTYLWSDGTSASSLLATIAGTYWVSATAPNGCIAKDTILITNKTNPVLDLGVDKGFCEGDTLVLDAQNTGNSFTWSNSKNTQSIKVFLAGKYSVNVVLANGCAASDEINITQNARPFVNLGDTIARCSNQLPFSIQAPGGSLSYLWNNGATTQSIQVSTAGNYLLTITDANLCSFMDTLNVKINAIPVVNLGNDAAFCQGGTFQLNANNSGANYLWANGETTQFLTVTVGGSYQVEVTNSKGCAASDDIIINMNIKPSVNLGLDRTLCSGATAFLNAGNTGSTYLWSDGSTNQTLNATVDGRYQITVTGTNGCKSTDDVLINIVSAPFQNLGTDIASCLTPTLDAGNLGSTYLWSTNAVSKQITASISGTYIVLVTNNNNCIVRDTIEVEVYPKPVVNLGNDISLCKLQTQTLDAQNFGSTYFWSNNTIERTLKVSENGLYKVTVTNSSQCVASDSVRVVVKDIPEFSFGTDKNICQGSNLVLSTSLPVSTSFLWSDGSTNNTLTVNTSNTFWLKATGSNNCTFSDTVQVNIRSYPIVSLGNNATVCGSITLDAKNPSSTYLWSDNVSTQTNTVSLSNTYSVKVTSEYGCVTSDTININVKNAPLVNLGADMNVCNGDNISLFANTDATNYKWNTGDTLATIKVLGSGKYELSASNANGCTSKDEIQVNFNDKPIVTLKSEYPICGSQPLVIDAENAGSTYLWTSANGFQSTQQKANITEDGVYILKVTNTFGCEAKDTIKANKNDFSLVAEFLATSSIKAGDTVKLINLSNPGVFKSKWDFGDGIVSEETDPVHIYFISGIVPVTLNVSNGICTDTKTKKLNIAARREITPKDSVYASVFISTKLYPNPTDGRFLFEVELNEKQKMALEFYSTSGQMIERRELDADNTHHLVFDRQDLANGTYFIRITVKNEQKFTKVLIIK